MITIGTTPHHPCGSAAYSGGVEGKGGARVEGWRVVHVMVTGLWMRAKMATAAMKAAAMMIQNSRFLTCRAPQDQASGSPSAGRPRPGRGWKGPSGGQDESMPPPAFAHLQKTTGRLVHLV
jgi:hypothetical protein